MHPLQEDFAPARRILAEELGASAARFLVERMSARELKLDQHLLRQGVHSDALFFTLSGRFGVFVEREPRPKRVGELRAGQWIGEVSFVAPGPASATVTAEEPALVLELRSRDIDRLADDAPEVAGALLQRLCSTLGERLVGSYGPRDRTTSSDRPRLSLAARLLNRFT